VKFGTEFVNLATHLQAWQWCERLCVSYK